MNDLALGVFAITLASVIARQLLSRGPPVWLLFSAGAVGMVAVGGLTLPSAVSAIATNDAVLLFLFGLFVLVAALESGGAIAHLAAWAAGRARRRDDLPFVLFVGLGLLSAFVVNDALVLVGTPVLIDLARRLRAPPEPLLLTLACAVTVGSVLTPFGNPQNLLVALQSGIGTPVTTFLRYLLLPTLINLGLGASYLRWRFRRDLPGSVTGLRPSERAFRPISGWAAAVRRAPAIAIFPGTIGAMVASELLASATGIPVLPLDLTALGGACLVLVVTPGRRRLLARVDFSILALFAALFVLVAGAVDAGILGALASGAASPGSSGGWIGLSTIAAAGLLGPQLVSNVPWVAIQIPVLHHLGYGRGDPLVWLALSGAATLAGNVTLLGAASNLIVVQQAERAGIALGLRRFVSVALPLALLSTAVLIVCLGLGL